MRFRITTKNPADFPADPRFRPLLAAYCPADPELVRDLEPLSIGSRMSTVSDIKQIDHRFMLTSAIGSAIGRIQTLGRVVMRRGDQIRALDIFSDPISPGFTMNHFGRLSPNLIGAETSRLLKLLEYRAASGAEVLGFVRIPNIPKAPPPDYLQVVGLKDNEKTPKTDVVVIQPSKQAGVTGLEDFARRLSREGFIPLALPLNGSAHTDDRYFPTDCFREVGSWLLYAHLSLLEDIKEKIRGIGPEFAGTQITGNLHQMVLPGGHYIHLDSQKRLLYDDKWFPEILSHLPEEMKNKWRIIRCTTRGINLKVLGYEADLDFALFPYDGKDGKIHALTTNSFRSRLPYGHNCVIHPLSDKDALKGGCNVADLRHGTVLIAPNRSEVPTTYDILKRTAKGTVIEGPAGFPSEGGGLRCSISSFAISV